MTIERIIILDGRKNAPGPGQVMANLLVGDQRARCVVSFEEDATILIQRDRPIERSPNVWWAVHGVLDRINRGETIVFPLDVTEDVVNGPWSLK